MTDADLRRSLSRAAERVVGLPTGSLSIDRPGSPPARLGEALGALNLGLVRVAEPAGFSWPGYWIGLLAGRDGPRAVVLFGVPSAVVEAPDGEPVAADARPVEGYIVAPLDLGRPHGSAAYTSEVAARGVVAGLYTAPEAGAPCVAHEQRHARPGRGLAGDRYEARSGTFSAADRTGQDLTLIEVEALDELRLATGIDLGPAEARRNVLTRGLRLEALIGHEFTIGTVRCRGARLAEPCAHLQRLTEPGVLRGLVHRGGIRADVLTPGVLRIGDAVQVATAVPRSADGEPPADAVRSP